MLVLSNCQRNYVPVIAAIWTDINVTINKMWFSVQKQEIRAGQTRTKKIN